jgi:hypothetical protein
VSTVHVSKAQLYGGPQDGAQVQAVGELPVVLWVGTGGNRGDGCADWKMERDAAFHARYVRSGSDELGVMAYFHLQQDQR